MKTNQISTSTVQKMSSIEIARLTGKQHRHVMRDIRNMLMELEIDESIFGHTYKDISNRRQACFNLPELEQFHTIRILPPQLLRYTERKATVPIKHFIPCFLFRLVYNKSCGLLWLYNPKDKRLEESRRTLISFA